MALHSQHTSCSPQRRAVHAGTDHDFARRIYRIMRLPVLGGMTQAEGTALGAFATSGAQAGRFAPSTNLGSHGTLLQDGVFVCSAFVCAMHVNVLMTS